MKARIGMNKDKFNILAFNDEQVNDELMDALIKAGAHEFIQNSTLEVPDAELSDIEFTKELDKKMLEYFGTIEKDQRNSKVTHIYQKAKNIALRAAAILLVLIVMAVGFVATSEATQLKLLHMYIEHSDIDSSFDFQDTGAKAPERQEIESLETMFWYIPDGFELIYEDHSQNIKTILYESFEGGYIDIALMTDGNLKIDSEEANNFNIEVNGHVCFVSEHDDKIIVVFNIGELNYIISTTIPLNEITKIIENIKY